MDNLNQPLNESAQVNPKRPTWPLIAVIIILVILIGIAWQFTGQQDEPVIISEPVPLPIVEAEPEVIPEVIPEIEIETPEVEIVVEDVLPVEDPLPSLDESDDWLKIKLPEITWRKELLTLIIDEDMIRRFVVFTDNFSQGTVAYEHSPFVLPSVKFSPESDTAVFQELEEEGTESVGKQNVWQWSEESSKRFGLYVDLLRSMDSESLVQWYIEVKPLIDEAYSELGYDDDFTNTLQNAITRVLDMELPKSSMDVIQPSVMYKFADPELEALPDTDKLLLRLGKENLLVMKSVLLELHEKLAQQRNGVQ